ncbi:MAG: MFS transporter [Rhodanobacter sp.]
MIFSTTTGFAACNARGFPMQTAHRESVFANHNFRLLFGGSTISMLGDQFTLVALPWLVLKLTGDPAALGIVLATMALPRAAFMLIGGAVVDRLSPRKVLLAARGTNALLVALLAILVLLGGIQMWLVYLIALGIGLSTAFAYPAGSAILPQLMTPQQLQPANALVMGMRQLSMFIGPALAGVVISMGARGTPRHTVQDAGGLGLAALALVHSTVTGAVLLAGTGVLGGIAQIAIVSWIQRRAADDGPHHERADVHLHGPGPDLGRRGRQPAESHLAAGVNRHRREKVKSGFATPAVDQSYSPPHNAAQARLNASAARSSISCRRGSARATPGCRG